MTEQTGDKKAFFISPIGDEGSEVRQRSDVVKRHILESSLCPDVVSVIERADEHANPGEITPAIIAAILEADLIIVDVTGANPNVFYEMAVAHAYGKPAVHIGFEDAPLPFDIKDVRVFPYRLDLEGGERARTAVREAAEFALATPHLVRTPISGGVALSSAQQSGDPSEQLAGTVLRRLDELGTELKQLSDRLDLGREGVPPSFAASNLSRLQRRGEAELAELESRRIEAEENGQLPPGELLGRIDQLRMELELIQRQRDLRFREDRPPRRGSVD